MVNELHLHRAFLASLQHLKALYKILSFTHSLTLSYTNGTPPKMHFFCPALLMTNIIFCITCFIAVSCSCGNICFDKHNILNHQYSCNVCPKTCMQPSYGNSKSHDSWTSSNSIIKQFSKRMRIATQLALIECLVQPHATLLCISLENYFFGVRGLSRGKTLFCLYIYN